MKRVAGDDWDAQRHEDKLTKGIPDVSFAVNGVHGWIELKVAELPKRPATPVDLRHFTPEQRIWLKRRAKHGCGGCFVLLQIGTTFFVLEPEHVVDGMTVDDFRSSALVIMEDEIDREILFAALMVRG